MRPIHGFRAESQTSCTRRSPLPSTRARSAGLGFLEQKIPRTTKVGFWTLSWKERAVGPLGDLRVAHHSKWESNEWSRAS